MTVAAELKGVLDWPPASLPLGDSVDLLITPVADIDAAAAREFWDEHITCVREKMQRNCPGTTDVQAVVFVRGEKLHGHVISAFPWVLCLRARFSEYQLPHQLTWRRLALLSAITS